MRWPAPRHHTRRAALGVLLALLAGCGLTLTSERPTYEELDPAEKSVVQVVLEELTAFNAAVKARSPFGIDAIIDRERINVAFQGKIFIGNLGDDVVHVSVWENLTSAQHALVTEWFKASSASAAQATYEKMFYRFLAVNQGAKQYIFEALTPEWVYGNRSLFNIERDATRLALAHYEAAGRRGEMWSFASSACAPILERYGPLYAADFSKRYLIDHATELANPDAPTGYMYYLCRWISMGQQDAAQLSVELQWIQDLPEMQ